MDMAGLGLDGIDVDLPSRLPASYGSLMMPLPCTPERGSSWDCSALWDWSLLSPQMTCEAVFMALLTESMLSGGVVCCREVKGTKQGRVSR